MRISIVIPTYRRPQTLRSTLSALLECRVRSDDYEVIVVDDAGDADTEAVVTSLQRRDLPTLTYMRNQGKGAAAARNAGARQAAGEIVLFLDDDMRVRADHLQSHLETHEEFSDALVGGKWSYSPESRSVLEASPFGRFRVALEGSFASARGEEKQHGASAVSTLPACDLSISRDDFWRLGGFDESFPYAGAEDQDFSTRAQRGGMQLIRNHDIPLLHDEVKTTLRAFAAREERGAHTVLALVRKFPEYEGAFVRNRPITRADPPRLIVSKLGKTALSSRPILGLILRITERLEDMGLPDRFLRPLYRVILGLHIFKGYRAAIRSSEREAASQCAASAA